MFRFLQYPLNFPKHAENVGPFEAYVLCEQFSFPFSLTTFTTHPSNKD